MPNIKSAKKNVYSDSAAQNFDLNNVKFVFSGQDETQKYRRILTTLLSGREI